MEKTSQVNDFFVSICFVTDNDVKKTRFLYKKGKTIKYLKERIHALAGINPVDQRIIVRGCLMTDNMVPIIAPNEVIYMIPTQGAIFEKPVKNDSYAFGKGLDGRNIGVPIDYDTATDDDLREYISHVYNKEKDSIDIILAGNLLKGVSLKETGLLKCACFHYVFR